MNWDTYFRNVATTVASKSPCLSRKFGAILVRDQSIIATGYNGPPRGHVHCGLDRYNSDPRLHRELEGFPKEDLATVCPRQLLGFDSGRGLHICHAEHAERNTIANAARMGVVVRDASLYLAMIGGKAPMPCKSCMSLLINAGISEIVVDEATFYDDAGAFIYYESNNINARTYFSKEVI